MTDTRNSFQKFLMPQNSVAEIFISSILVMAAIILIFQRGNYGDIWFLFLLCFAVCAFLLFSSTVINVFNFQNKKLLKLTQIFGSTMVFIISIFYAFTLLVITGISNIQPIDYLFSIFLFITIIRFVLLYIILVVGKEVDYVFKTMPGIKNDNINFFIILALLLVSLFIFYKYSSILSIALGRAFFTAVLLIDTLTFIKTWNRNTVILAKKS